MNWTPLVNLVGGRIIDGVGNHFRKTPTMPQRINPEDYLPKYESAIAAGGGDAPPGTPNPAEMASQSTSGASAVALPTTAETREVLRKDLAKELYRFQLDLARGCKIAGKPCDCCEKHPILGMEALVEELIPMEPENPIYSALTLWIKANAHKLTMEASGSGKYDADYPHLAADIRAFRKDLLGTESLSAMVAATKEMSLEEAKSEAASPAAQRDQGLR